MCATINAPSWALPLPEGVLGSLTEVLCERGSRVYADEVVAVIETDKVTVDVKAERSGVVTAILAEVDEDIKIRQALFTIDENVALPPAGSAEHQAERRWARSREIRLEEEKAAADREWQEMKKRDAEARQRGDAQYEWTWHFSNSARARQMAGRGQNPFDQTSSSAGGSGWQQRQKFRRRPEAAAGHARAQSAPKPLPPSEVLTLPVHALIERVLAGGTDPYACLLLPRAAATSSVRKRYLALAMRLHPDKAVDQPRAREAMVAITQARRTIKEGRRW